MPSRIQVRKPSDGKWASRDIEIIQGMAVTGITLEEARILVRELPVLIDQITRDRPVDTVDGGVLPVTRDAEIIQQVEDVARRMVCEQLAQNDTCGLHTVLYDAKLEVGVDLTDEWEVRIVNRLALQARAHHANQEGS